MLRHAFPRLTSCLQMAFSKFLRQGSFAPGNQGIATTGGRSAPQKTGLRCRIMMKRAIDMTDDELAAIASRATLHVHA